MNTIFKLKIKIYGAKCTECENGQKELYVAMIESDPASYYCECCGAEDTCQMYSLPNSELLKEIPVEIESEWLN
jgi:hypothetical protein